jgi:hypothetical protein
MTMGGVLNVSLGVNLTAEEAEAIDAYCKQAIIFALLELVQRHHLCADATGSDILEGGAGLVQSSRAVVAVAGSIRINAKSRANKQEDQNLHPRGLRFRVRARPVSGLAVRYAPPSKKSSSVV